jgi:hypothetical protein
LGVKTGTAIVSDVLSEEEEAWFFDVRIR